MLEEKKEARTFFSEEEDGWSTDDELDSGENQEFLEKKGLCPLLSLTPTTHEHFGLSF